MARGRDDERIWCATFDGAVWTDQHVHAGTGTSNGPAMAVFQDQLYLVWNGANIDPSIWFTTFDGEQPRWRDPQQQVSGVATNESPAVTVFHDRLYMAWGGLGTPYIFWSFFDGQKWATFPDGSPQQMSDSITGSGPALVVFDPMAIPFSQQTRLSRLTHELQQASLESARLLGQAQTLSEKTRQLGQTAIETARSLLLADQEGGEDGDDQSG